jgi:hypothetical protein
MRVPRDMKTLAPWAMDIIEKCRSSASARAALARTYRTWRFSGSPDGSMAILNRLGHHIDRLASYLFSPNDLRFHMDFTHNYEKNILDQAEVAARVLTREFERRDIDMAFGEGVDLALTYGCCILKVINTHDGITCKLVMPWQFGVYREGKTDLNEQEAMVETNLVTPHDMWRRISHLPDAEKLFKKAVSYAKKRSGGEETENFFHQVLLAGSPPIVQTDPPFTTQPGGLAQVQANPMGAIMAPEVAQDLICVHELWVRDDETEDWTTIQIAEPDIVIAPRFKAKNMFVPEEIPYGVVRPNGMSGYFFGRSELSDMLKLQHLLRDRLEDIKRLMSLQYDRLLAFSGGSGITDEAYDQFRTAGYINLESGAKVEDLTPELPKEAFQDIHEILKMIDEVSGFQNILSGQGEPGVRAGNHAETLLKTASPRLRDRALLVERQCADLAHKVVEALRAKDDTEYWTKDGKGFLLAQIPEDYRVLVDSHSSSPIYEEDHKQIAEFLAKLGVIDGESLLDLLSVPMRDILKVRYADMQKKKAEQQEKMKEEIIQHPEIAKALMGGGKKK